MPVTVFSPSDPKIYLPLHNNDILLNVKNEDLRSQQINCFQNGKVLNKLLEGSTVYVNINPITQPGRHRVNCTAPSISEKGRFYWFSHPFFMPTAEGKWLD